MLNRLQGYPQEEGIRRINVGVLAVDLNATAILDPNGAIGRF